AEKRRAKCCCDDADRGERPARTQASNPQHIADECEREESEFHHRRRIGCEKRARGHVPPRGESRKLYDGENETERDAGESEACRTLRGVIVERAIRFDSPASEREVPKPDRAGAEEQRHETDEFLDGFRPFE